MPESFPYGSFNWICYTTWIISYVTDRGGGLPVVTKEISTVEIHVPVLFSLLAAPATKISVTLGGKNEINLRICPFGSFIPNVFSQPLVLSDRTRTHTHTKKFWKNITQQFSRIIRIRTILCNFKKSFATLSKMPSANGHPVVALKCRKSLLKQPGSLISLKTPNPRQVLALFQISTSLKILSLKIQASSKSRAFLSILTWP